MNILERMDGETILERIDQRITEHTQLAMTASTLEVQLKSWEAAQKAALMDAGTSAVAAEAKIRGEPEWAGRYIELEEARLRAAECKARVDQGIRYFELWRSRFSAEKRATA